MNSASVKDPAMLGWSRAMYATGPLDMRITTPPKERLVSKQLPQLESMLPLKIK
jgi:hypothetical protein